MRKSKHKKRQWKAHRTSEYALGWVIIQSDVGKQGIHYHQVDYNGFFTEEDAKLIAAAPKMLEVLENIQHCISTKGFAEIHHGSFASSDISNAIKQAKGDK